MSYIIRLAKEEDCNELSKLKHDVWNETYRGIIDETDEDNNDKSIPQIYYIYKI